MNEGYRVHQVRQVDDRPANTPEPGEPDQHSCSYTTRNTHTNEHTPYTYLNKETTAKKVVIQRFWVNFMSLLKLQ